MNGGAIAPQKAALAIGEKGDASCGACEHRIWLRLPAPRQAALASDAGEAPGGNFSFVLVPKMGQARARARARGPRARAR